MNHSDNALFSGKLAVVTGAGRSGPQDWCEALPEQRHLRMLLKTEGIAWDAAKAVAFGARDAGQHITGQVLTVDEGFSLNLTMNGRMRYCTASRAFSHSCRIHLAQATLFSKIEYFAPAP